MLFAARGSSDNAAIYGRYLLEVHAGRERRPRVPERGHPLPVPARPLGRPGRVCVSQSGATEEIVTTEEWARGCGAATVAVTNVAGSPLVEAAPTSPW